LFSQIQRCGFERSRAVPHICVVSKSSGRYLTTRGSTRDGFPGHGELTVAPERSTHRAPADPTGRPRCAADYLPDAAGYLSSSHAAAAERHAQHAAAAAVIEAIAAINRILHTYPAYPSPGGGRSQTSSGASRKTARPRWSRSNASGSYVGYTPAEVVALTPVRQAVEKSRLYLLEESVSSATKIAMFAQGNRCQLVHEKN
jgi:hypothetical protein